ncbi:single-stranded-DNA-specific exonuclease RecJ [Candidatus Kuenenbacteria bacterium HGW-Kuenenbacteria-1]|uniref:Single-stranded-DNA-specific exonuclease RecJ n=1 Tax=Candidatus Kuenenbacteria bacterium HGW-Kuenenbacteria-1 TaxID=2013812 RepID=A0A2N1UNR6_9BACT|nr:MAG: single-stranded-DNA-specific exonuclease RecJ [Candidatus Kuenenbacteria bacterium HGW-Kuenenbacteria-1]
MRWIINKSITINEKKQFSQINPIVLQLLFNRELKTQKQIDEFLYSDYSQDIHDPFLLPEMGKAVQRIFQAIKDQELIMVHGDYDADGICGSLLLIETLEKLGARTDIYIPHREKEGYGLKEQAVDYMMKQENKKMQNTNGSIPMVIKNKTSGNGLIITVDCGITNIDGIKYAQKNNIDVIITDHHLPCKNIPKAFAIIHPKTGNEYPFKDLAGAGVAFKLAQALLRKKEQESTLNFKGFEKWLLDLLVIATVADLVPMLGENKTLTKYGLIVLNKTKRIGLKKLIEISKLSEVSELNVFNVGFQIAPRINSLGRLKHANTSYQLLKTQDENEAKKIAEELDQTNQERQRLIEEAVLQVLNQLGKITDKQKILFVLNKNWPEGILGLIAGKICNKFNRPTMAMTYKINNNQQAEIVGSGRSNNFNLKLALEKIENILTSFGGHKCACGFKFLENNLENFKKKLEKIANKEISDQDLIPILNIDQEITLAEVNWELFNELKKFEPYGKENPQPKFLIKNLRIINLEKVGQNEQHLKLSATDEQVIIKMIGFGLGEKGGKFNIGNRIDIISEININEWNGNKELQLKIVDLKTTEL